MLEGKLYCAHSNCPRFPEASSVEISDTNTLAHFASASLGICDGSLTWIDWRNDSLWAGFARYTEQVSDNPHAKGTRYESELPHAGAELRHVRTRKVPFTGQGFVWDRGRPDVIHGIDRPRGQVIVARVELPVPQPPSTGK